MCPMARRSAAMSSALSAGRSRNSPRAKPPFERCEKFRVDHSAPYPRRDDQQPPFGNAERFCEKLRVLVHVNTADRNVLHASRDLVGSVLVPRLSIASGSENFDLIAADPLCLEIWGQSGDGVPGAPRRSRGCVDRRYQKRVCRIAGPANTHYESWTPSAFSWVLHRTSVTVPSPLTTSFSSAIARSIAALTHRSTSTPVRVQPNIRATPWTSSVLSSAPTSRTV